VLQPYILVIDIDQFDHKILHRVDQCFYLSNDLTATEILLYTLAEAFRCKTKYQEVHGRVENNQ
jgi:hypothetical protein